MSGVGAGLNPPTDLRSLLDCGATSADIQAYYTAYSAYAAAYVPGVESVVVSEVSDGPVSEPTSEVSVGSSASSGKARRRALKRKRQRALRRQRSDLSRFTQSSSSLGSDVADGCYGNLLVSGEAAVGVVTFEELLLRPDSDVVSDGDLALWRIARTAKGVYHVGDVGVPAGRALRAIAGGMAVVPAGTLAERLLKLEGSEPLPSVIPSVLDRLGMPVRRGPERAVATADRLVFLNPMDLNAVVFLLSLLKLTSGVVVVAVVWQATVRSSDDWVRAGLYQLQNLIAVAGVDLNRVVLLTGCELTCGLVRSALTDISTGDLARMSLGKVMIDQLDYRAGLQHMRYAAARPQVVVASRIEPVAQADLEASFPREVWSLASAGFRSCAAVVDVEPSSVRSVDASAYSEFRLADQVYDRSALGLGPVRVPLVGSAAVGVVTAVACCLGDVSEPGALGAQLRRYRTGAFVSDGGSDRDYREMSGPRLREECPDLVNCFTDWSRWSFFSDDKCHVISNESPVGHTRMGSVHLLVIPKARVRNGGSLRQCDIPLLYHMKRAFEAAWLDSQVRDEIVDYEYQLAERGADDASEELVRSLRANDSDIRSLSVSDFRFGFMMKQDAEIFHMHMHVFAGRATLGLREPPEGMVFLPSLGLGLLDSYGCMASPASLSSV